MTIFITTMITILDHHDNLSCCNHHNQSHSNHLKSGLPSSFFAMASTYVWWALSVANDDHSCDHMILWSFMWWFLSLWSDWPTPTNFVLCVLYFLLSVRILCLYFTYALVQLKVFWHPRTAHGWTLTTNFVFCVCILCFVFCVLCWCFMFCILCFVFVFCVLYFLLCVLYCVLHFVLCVCILCFVFVFCVFYLRPCAIVESLLDISALISLDNASQQG